MIVLKSTLKRILKDQFRLISSLIKSRVVLDKLK